MKYLKTFNENMNRSEIDAICEKYGIINYTINEDGTIDIDGVVDLSNNKLTELPLKFRKVSGWFECTDNQLITLEGAPIYVGGDFNCENNKLTSLKYCPKYIGDGFACFNNNIKNIDYLPTTFTDFDIDNNPIYSILKLFILYDDTYDDILDRKENKELLYSFQDREIIEEDILIIDRLVEFLEDVNKPQTKEYLYQLLEKEYEIR